MKKTEILKNAIDFAEANLGEVDDISIYNNFDTVYVEGVTADGRNFSVNVRIEKKVKADD